MEIVLDTVSHLWHSVRQKETRYDEDSTIHAARAHSEHALRCLERALKSCEVHHLFFDGNATGLLSHRVCDRERVVAKREIAAGSVLERTELASQAPRPATIGTAITTPNAIVHGNGVPTSKLRFDIAAFTAAAIGR